MKRILVVGCLVLLAGCASRTLKPIGMMESARFGNDGRIIIGTKYGECIQLIGIRVPEYNEDASEEVKVHRAMSRSMLLRLIGGKQLEVEHDGLGTGEISLGYVYAGGLFINAEMIKRGYAYAISMPQDNKYDAMFKSLEKAASSKSLGLWRYTLKDGGN